MKYTIYAPSTGQIQRVVSCDPSQIDAQLGGSLVAIEGDFADDLFYIADGVPVSMPTSPSSVHTFNWQTKQWEDLRTLQDLKLARRTYVNTERLKANQTSFTHLGKAIEADQLSRGDIDAINGEVNNTGDFPADWPGAWKCLDNTWIPIVTVAEWRALYTSMVNQGTVNFAKAQALKAQIEAATTAQEVAAIAW